MQPWFSILFAPSWKQIAVWTGRDLVSIRVEHVYVNDFEKINISTNNIGANELKMKDDKNKYEVKLVQHYRNYFSMVKFLTEYRIKWWRIGDFLEI